MNRTEIIANVAPSTSLSKSDAASAVGVVFRTIGDALAGGEAVTIAGFGTFTTRDRPAREGRNPRTGETIAIAASRARLQGRQDAARIRQPNVLVSARPETDRMVPPSQMMCVAGRRRGKFRYSSPARTHAQSRADLDSFRAWGPHMARGDFSAATMMRNAAQPNYSERFPTAYGPDCSRTDAPHRPPGTKTPVLSTDCRRDVGPPLTVASVAGTRRREFFDPPHVRTRAQPRAGIEPLRARAPYFTTCGFSSAPALRAPALQSLPARSLTDFGAAPLAVQPLAQREPAESIDQPSGRRLGARSRVFIALHVHPTEYVNTPYPNCPIFYPPRENHTPSPFPSAIASLPNSRNRPRC